MPRQLFDSERAAEMAKRGAEVRRRNAADRRAQEAIDYVLRLREDGRDVPLTERQREMILLLAEEVTR